MFKKTINQNRRQIICITYLEHIYNIPLITLRTTVILGVKKVYGNTNLMLFMSINTIVNNVCKENIINVLNQWHIRVKRWLSNEHIRACNRIITHPLALIGDDNRISASNSIS